MSSFDHRIQCFGVNRYILTWRSDHPDTPPGSEPYNAATMDRTSATSVCALYGLVLPDEPPIAGSSPRRTFRRLLNR